VRSAPTVDRTAQQVLLDLTQLRGVRSALLATSDGRPVAGVGVEGDQGSPAAFIAASRGLGERLADLTGAGELLEIVVRSTSGYVAVYAIGARGVLTVLTDSAANLAMVHLKARELNEELRGCVDRLAT
jgi:predicted regulator of Ras-like GTPase activity (Roadblock/LC7/MglB family)